MTRFHWKSCAHASGKVNSTSQYFGKRNREREGSVKKPHRKCISQIDVIQAKESKHHRISQRDQG